MENSPAAPRDFSKMTDEELDAAISAASAQAPEAAPRDFSKMTDEELDASISAASAPAPIPAPTFDFDDVAKGMSADEASRAASYPKVAQSMLDRHAAFTDRMSTDGGFKLSVGDETDYEYFKWAERRGVFGPDPTFTDYAGAVGKSFWQIVKGGAKLAVLAGKVVVSGDSDAAPAVELAATAVDAARLAKSEYEQLGAGAAVLFSGDNPEVKSAAKFELLKFTTAEQKNHNAWRKALSDRFAEVPVDQDSVEALSEGLDIGNVPGMGAGKALTRAARRAGMGGTEWLDASRKVLGSEALGRAVAKIPVIGTSQKRAILVGQVDLLSVEAQQAYDEVASAQSKLAAARATLAENGVGPGAVMDPLLAAVTKSEAAVATSTASYKAAQTQLDGARRSVSDALDLEGRGLLNIAAAGTVDAAGKVTKFTGDSITAGWNATKKFATGSSDNALADTLAPGIVSQGNVVSRAGRDLSGIAAQIRANDASIPFFRRVAQAEGIGKLTKATAAFADFSHLGFIADKGAELAGASLAGAPVSGAFGYVASGGDTLAAAGSAGGGMAFGISGGAYGQWQSYTDPRFRHEELLANRRQFRDHLSVRPVNGQSQLQVFDKMDAGEQLLLATYAQGHPDVAFRLITDEKGPSGYYDRDNNVVVLNTASKTSVPDIFRHEVAHFIERHGMEAQVRELYLGDAEKGVVGEYTAFGADGKPTIVETPGPDGQTTKSYQLNAKGEALRGQYEAKVRAFDPTFTMSPQYFASELFAEQYADHVVNGGLRRDLSRNAVDSAFEALGSVPLLKGFMGAVGLMFDQNDAVVGTGVFAGLGRNAGVGKLVSAWNSEAGKGRRGSGVEEPDAHVFTERELRDPEVAKKWLQGGGAMRFGPDGAPVYNANGTPQFLTDKEAEAAQRDLANELVVAIERHAVDNPEDADVMQRRENTDINGKVSVTYSGRKIPASVIDALEAQKRFNPHQLAHLRAMSASVDAHGVGAMIAHFYQAASRKLSGKAYKTTGGRWRRDGVVGFQITKDANVIINSVSWEQLAESARKAAVTAAARDLYQSSGVDIAAAITADTKTYLENVVAGRPGSEGIGDKRRDFINNLFGIRMASNEDVNPFFATTKSPKPILTSLRLDRINRLAPLDSVEFAWGPAEYRRVKANLRPDSAIDSAAAGEQSSENGDRLRQYRPEPGSKVEPGQVQHGNKKLEHSIGDEFVNLVHYSSNGGLTNVDPKSLGKGLATQNDLRGLPKSFYFVQGSKLGADRGLVSGQGKSTYVAKVSGNRIYDGNADAHGYWDIINREKADQMLVDKGFAGLAVTGSDGRSTVTLFKKTNVQKMDTDAKEKRAGANLSFRPDAAELQGWGDEQFRPDGVAPAAPEKTIKAYKMFRTLKSRPGELFPLFIGKTTPVPMGEWIAAQHLPTPGFAERPGWHAGAIPSAPHLMSRDGEMQAGRVWAEVEMPADRDYTPEAQQTKTKDIRDHVPEGGFYRFSTQKEQGEHGWVIGGALKVSRILKPEEVDAINAKAGVSTTTKYADLNIQYHPGQLTRDNVPKKRDVEDFITTHALTPAEAEAYREVADNVRSADPSALPVDPQYDKDGRPKFEVTPAMDGAPERTEVKVSPTRYDFIEAPEVLQIRARNEAKHAEKVAALEEKRKVADRKTAAKINAKIAEVKDAWKREGQFAWRDEASDILADRLVEEAEKAKLEPSTKAGLGWYSNMRAWLQNRFGAGIEVFSQLLGASSARTPVDENFKQALDAITRLSRGDYDTLLQRFDDHVSAVREKVDAGSLDEDAARKEINKFVEVPTRSNGKKFNANSAKVLQALYGNWLELTQGPKTPNFAGNLSGRILAATIDVWAARTARRLLYQNKTYNAETGRISGGANKWRILPEAETGVEFGRKIGLDIGGDFGFAQEAFQKAADRLGMEADNLQALIWYHEKHIWDVNNWTRAAGRVKSSFESEAGKLDTERFQIGATTDTGASANFDAHVIDSTFHGELKQTRDAVTQLPGVVYARVTPSQGLYGGNVEPSFDAEFVVRRGSDISPILSHLIDTGNRASQYDVFLSKVVDKSHPNRRPGLEIGFKAAETQQFVDDLSASLRAAGVDGFTVARDSRNRPIGLRTQFIPEISARWAAVKEDLLDPVKADALAGEWTEKSRAALKSLQPDIKTRLSYEQESYFDTRVFGREEYSTASRVWAETTLDAELGRRKQALGGTSP